VRAPADIGAHQHLPLQVLGGDLRQRQPQHVEVIAGGVRPGVPRSENRRQRLADLIQPAPERMKPVPVLVVPGHQLLIGVRGQQRRVDVERQRVRPGARVPHPRPRCCAGGPDLTQQPLVDRLQHPMRRGLRRPSAEQPLLPTVGIQIGHAVAAVGEHHRHINENPARIMRRAPLPRQRQRLRQPARQTNAVGQRNRQCSPGVGHHTLAVRRDFYRSQPSLWLHQPGVLLDRRSRPRKSRFTRSGRTFPHAAATPLPADRG